MSLLIDLGDVSTDTAAEPILRGFPVASVSDAGSSNVLSQQPSRPAADKETYICTCPGCIRRFETPELLQKPRREGHRRANAPPHRCMQMNPSTGKPCGTVFSRPYDLTRHENTSHNPRKPNMRCDLCTEDKTFSRADALTRHYRVCHPDVESPGKDRN
ncbi:Uu.00g130650.m01.CDS01 [Anthostomella pinea]|uniref:Uu.00g130650.m01.CDS01 n=1 Tax=Anthostomella pinea TaxID=933095 RepID=A0AAI8YI75_9PEZI|nr:Uu.00g130650.m01.CDS01 [Anthostomella pinea]